MFLWLIKFTVHALLSSQYLFVVNGSRRYYL